MLNWMLAKLTEEAEDEQSIFKLWYAEMNAGNIIESNEESSGCKE